MILSIDPGNIESAYAVLDESLKPVEFGKVHNSDLLKWIQDKTQTPPFLPEHFVIEMVACYGMPVGKEVFDTCVWIGRFWQAAGELPHKQYIYRKEEKLNLCGTMKAKDANIRQALIDRFGVVGTKKNPGWFYGVSKDVWSAIAVGVCYHDLYLSDGGRG